MRYGQCIASNAAKAIPVIETASNAWRTRSCTRDTGQVIRHKQWMLCSDTGPRECHIRRSALAAFGAGALVGGAAGLAGNLPRRGILILVLFLIMSGAKMLIPGAGAFAAVPGVAANLLVMGVATGLSNVTYGTAVQQRFARANSWGAS